MGPPRFTECFVCHREFGSRSLEFHVPQCLERWHWDQKKVPKSERKRTPSPPPNHPLHRSNLPQPSPAKSPSPTLCSVPTDNSLSNSWPEQRSRKSRPKSSTFMDRRKGIRPKTATLDKPKILDAKMCNEIDMSVMSRRMMEKLVLKKEGKTSSDYYSSDFSSSSSSSMSIKSPYDDDLTESESENKKRPSTIRLKRPSSNISVPVIAPSTARSLPRRGKTATMRSSMPMKKRLELAQDILENKEKVKIPEPCLTCGKEQNPERFHSHPKHLTKFKAKDKISKDRKEIPYKTISKLIVTKPNPLKFKSKSIETNSSGNSNKETRKSKHKTISTKIMKSKPKERKFKTSSQQPAQSPRRPEDFGKTFTRSKKEKKPLVEIFHNNNNDKKEAAILNKLEEEEMYDSINEPLYETFKKTISKSSSPTNSRLGSAPLRTCYICGRDFGSRSLKIHEPQCLEKWKRENAKLAQHHRRQVPQKPSRELSKDEWNDFAWKTAQAQLVPCENCGRTFNPDRLEVHQRGCKPRRGTKKPKERPRESSPVSLYGSTGGGRGSARPTIMCYICGREFGTKSITIHEPQCLTKFKNENERLPEQMRRTEPRKPDLVLDESGKINRDAMVEAAWQSHLETLVKCEGCGRTFLPDRLAVHRKACKSVK